MPTPVQTKWLMVFFYLVISLLSAAVAVSIVQYWLGLAVFPGLFSATATGLFSLLCVAGAFWAIINFFKTLFSRP